MTSKSARADQYLFQRNIRTSNTSFTPTDNLLKTWVISIHSFSLFLLHNIIPYSASSVYKTTTPPSLSLEHTNRINCQSISFVISILFHYSYFIQYQYTQRPAYIIKQPPLASLSLEHTNRINCQSFRFPRFSINLSKKIDTTKDYYK